MLRHAREKPFGGNVKRDMLGKTGFLTEIMEATVRYVVKKTGRNGRNRDV